MQPVSPVVPGYRIQETTISSKDPRVKPLPVIVTDDGEAILTRWELSPEDRQRIADGQDIFLWVTNYGKPLHPINLEVITPEELINRTNPGEGDASKIEKEDEWPDIIGAKD